MGLKLIKIPHFVMAPSVVSKRWMGGGSTRQKDLQQIPSTTPTNNGLKNCKSFVPTFTFLGTKDIYILCLFESLVCLIKTANSV